MDEKRISDALRALPREKASPGFTAGVMRRLRPVPPKRMAWPVMNRVLVPVGAAFLLLALLVGGREWNDRRERAETIARFESLRSEQQAIEAELTQLQRLRELQNAAHAKPVLYLGSSGDVDLVVDLDRLRRRQNGNAAGDAAADANREMRPLLVHAESLDSAPATYAW